jgi:hypothetical protein
MDLVPSIHGNLKPQAANQQTHARNCMPPTSYHLECDKNLKPNSPEQKGFSGEIFFLYVSWISNAPSLDGVKTHYKLKTSHATTNQPFGLVDSIRLPP